MSRPRLRAPATIAACAALITVPATDAGGEPVPAPLQASGLHLPTSLHELRGPVVVRPRPAAPRRAKLTKAGRVIAPAGAPARVQRVIAAANRIARKPYVWGGGHGSWRAAGYDCSGSVGYALHGGGLLDRAVTSGGLATYGRPGRGRWITVYAHGGHTYLEVAGLRFDTSAYKRTGSRWTRARGDRAGYAVRHPAGL